MQGVVLRKTRDPVTAQSPPSFSGRRGHATQPGAAQRRTSSCCQIAPIKRDSPVSSVLATATNLHLRLKSLVSLRRERHSSKRYNDPSQKPRGRTKKNGRPGEKSQRPLTQAGGEASRPLPRSDARDLPESSGETSPRRFQALCTLAVVPTCTNFSAEIRVYIPSPRTAIPASRKP